MAKKSKQTIARLREQNHALFTEVEILHAKLEAAERERDAAVGELKGTREEIAHLRPRVENLEGLNDRLTVLLSNEQALRMKALPRPTSWFGRVFGRRASRVDIASAS